VGISNQPISQDLFEKLSTEMDITHTLGLSPHVPLEDIDLSASLEQVSLNLNVPQQNVNDMPNTHSQAGKFLMNEIWKSMGRVYL